MEINNSPAKENRLIDTEKGLKDYYEVSADIVDYSKISGSILNKEQRRTEYIIDWMDLHKNESLLDVGCGDGLQIEAFSRHNSSLDLYGIDISEKRIQRTAARVRASLRVGSAYKLPYESNKFDGVICSEVLEHVPNPEFILGEIFRVLKPKGKLAVSVPYCQQITYDICAHCGKPTPTSGHINSFNERRMFSMLENAGLYPIIVRGAVGSASLITPFRKIPFLLWRFLDQAIRSIRKDDIFLIALAQKNKLKRN